jgi:hypothetical protein
MTAKLFYAARGEREGARETKGKGKRDACGGGSVRACVHITQGRVVKRRRRRLQSQHNVRGIERSNKNIITIIAITAIQQAFSFSFLLRSVFL